MHDQRPISSFNSFKQCAVYMLTNNCTHDNNIYIYTWQAWIYECIPYKLGPTIKVILAVIILLLLIKHLYIKNYNWILKPSKAIQLSAILYAIFFLFQQASRLNEYYIMSTEDCYKYFIWHGTTPLFGPQKLDPVRLSWFIFTPIQMVADDLYFVHLMLRIYHDFDHNDIMKISSKIPYIIMFVLIIMSSFCRSTKIYIDYVTHFVAAEKYPYYEKLASIVETIRPCLDIINNGLILCLYLKSYLKYRQYVCRKNKMNILNHKEHEILLIMSQFLVIFGWAMFWRLLDAAWLLYMDALPANYNNKGIFTYAELERIWLNLESIVQISNILSIYLSFEFSHKSYRCICKLCHCCIYCIFVKTISKNIKTNKSLIMSSRQKQINNLQIYVELNNENLNRYKTPNRYRKCPICSYKYKKYFKYSAMDKYKCYVCGHDFKSNKNINNDHENELNLYTNLETTDEYDEILKLIKSKSNGYNECRNKDKCKSFRLISLISDVYSRYCQNMNSVKLVHFLRILSKNDTMSCFGQNGYDITNLLDDYIHIVKYHDVDDDVKEECVDINCMSFKRHRRDKSKDNLRDKAYCNRYFHTTNSNEIYLQNIFDKMHCFIHHRNDNVSQDKWKNAIKNNNKRLIEYDMDKYGILPDEYIFTKPMNYNNPSILPINCCFKDELNINDETWQKELKYAQQLISTKHAKHEYMNTNDDFYGIRFGDKIGIEHILALRFYCSYTMICNQFRKSFRKINVSYHYENYYFFGRFLYEAIQFNGKRLDTKLYLGINKRKLFRSLEPCFGQPTSTTMDFDIAAGFAMDSYNNTFGLILELDQQFKSSTSKLETRYYFCPWISDFPNERECLLFGFDNTILIKNIWIKCDNDNKWKSLEFEINALNYWQKISGGYSGINSFNIQISSNKNNQYYWENIQKCLVKLIEFELNDDMMIDNVPSDPLKYIHKLFHYMLITKTGSDSDQIYSITNNKQKTILLDVDFRNINYQNIINKMKKYLFMDDNVTISEVKIAKLYPNINKFADQTGNHVILQNRYKNNKIGFSGSIN